MGLEKVDPGTVAPAQQIEAIPFRTKKNRHSESGCFDMLGQGYRPRVDLRQAHAASCLARKRSTRRRPLTSTLNPSNSVSIHRHHALKGDP